MDANTTCCECGCGEAPRPGNRFISGHNRRVSPIAQRDEVPTMDETVTVTDAPIPSETQRVSEPADHLQTRTPGVYVDMTKFVILHSRVSRMMQALPKIDPNDDKEEIKYHVPEAFERGEIVDISDLYGGPALGYANGIDRLVALNAIGRLDEEESKAAIRGLEFRRAQEASAVKPFGVI